MHRYLPIIQVLAIAALACLVAGGIYGFLFLQIKEKKTSFGNLQNTIELQTEREAELVSIRGVLDATSVDRGALDAYFVGKDTVVDFIDELGQLASVADVTMDVTSVTVVSAGGGEGAVSEKLVLSLNVAGTWNQVLHFVSLLETVPFRVDLSNVRLTYRGQDDNKKSPSRLWDATVSFTVAKIR